MAAVTACQRPEAVFQLLLWLSGEQSARVCPASPATTLFRHSHLKSPQEWTDKSLSPAAAAQYAAVTQKTLDRADCLLALRLPGRAEYLAALDEAVHRAVRGKTSPAEALGRRPLAGGRSTSGWGSSSNDPPIYTAWGWKKGRIKAEEGRGRVRGEGGRLERTWRTARISCPLFLSHLPTFHPSPLRPVPFPISPGLTISTGALCGIWVNCWGRCFPVPDPKQGLPNERVAESATRTVRRNDARGGRAVPQTDHGGRESSSRWGVDFWQ